MFIVENKNTIENCGETFKNINITYVHSVWSPHSAHDRSLQNYILQI